jgi:hypothetical protein
MQQWPPGENNSSDHPEQDGSLSHFTMPNNLVDRRTKYYSQASHLVRPHQSSCLCSNTWIGYLRNNSRTFTKRLNFLWFLNPVFFIVFFSFPVLLILSSLFSYPYSLPLHFPSFSCVTIPNTLSASSHPLSHPSSSPPPILPQSVTSLPLPLTHSPPPD